MSLSRAAPAVAWPTAGLALALVVAALLVAGPQDQEWKPVLLPVLWAVPGALVASGRPRIPLGWLLLGTGLLFAASALASRWMATDAAGSDWAAWLADRAGALVVPLTVLLLLLLPDGQLPSPRWRPVAWAAVSVQTILVLAWSLVAGPAGHPDREGAAGTANPLGLLPASWGPVLDALSGPVLQGPLLLGVAAVVARLRRAGPERRTVLDVLLAVAVFAVVVVVGRALWPAVADVLDVAAAALVAITMTSAVLRRRLPGVEVVVHHAFVFSVLTGLIAVAYVVAVAAAARAGLALPDEGAGVVAAVIALCLLPLRGVLQRWLRRAVYGDARDPGIAVRRLTEQVTDADGLDAVVAGLAATTAASLRARHVLVEVGTARAARGQPGPGESVRRELVASDHPLGELVVTLPPGRRAGRHDEELLDALVAHGARAVLAVQLAEALQHSRHLLVTAREDERARLRRDLHDELGPTLAALAMQLAGLQDLVTTDPATARERLSRLEQAARQALEDVRRLSRGLRPPSLDDLGLVGALVRVGEDAGLRVETDTGSCGQATARARTDDVIAPATEVAAYRIGAEALLNVARHAGTDRAGLEVARTDAGLVLRVVDHGCGTAGAAAGVGMLAMRERAGEVGGTLQVCSTHAGTIVEARLPLEQRRSGAAVATQVTA